MAYVIFEFDIIAEKCFLTYLGTDTPKKTIQIAGEQLTVEFCQYSRSKI
jgi:hypothetical protein